MSGKGTGLHSFVALLTLSCTGSDGEGSRWHEEPPELTVRVAAESLTLARVEAVLAPDLQFEALVEPDPHHILAVTAPVTGTLVAIEPEEHARRGKMVAVIRQGAGRTARERAVTMPEDGVWRPRRYRDQFVWAGDTLGTLLQHGLWLAVGSVSDLEYGGIHRDDSASVRVDDGLGRVRPGRVESVRPPGKVMPYSAEVAVEFRGPEELLSGWSYRASVVVSPVSPEDSVLAVPASAVVQLSLGPAVFVQMASGQYQVRWVTTGRVVGGMTIVREGLEAGMLVVAGGLEALATAARDSLSARTRGAAPRR